jgi:hypothetical protein
MYLERAFAHVLTAVTAAPQSVLTRGRRDDLHDVDLADVALKIPIHYAGVALWACYEMLTSVDSLRSGRGCAFARSILYRELFEQRRKRMAILRRHQR